MHIRSLRPTSWLAQRLGLSVSTIKRLRAQGGDTLPPHVIIGFRSIRYAEDVVEAWIAQRLQPAASTAELSSPARQRFRVGSRLVGHRPGSALSTQEQ